jgi:hypothetical protein
MIQNAISRASEHFAGTGEIEWAAGLFLAVPGARNFYILDDAGFDIGSFSSEQYALDIKRQARLGPVQPNRESRLFHRRYFRDAMLWPDQFHFIPSKYSFFDGTVSNFVAKAVAREGRHFVICGTYDSPQ